MKSAAASAPYQVRRPQRASGVVRLAVRDRLGHPSLQSLYQEGSAQVRFPARRPRDPLEAVLINTAGGMTGGDRFGWKVELGADACCQVVTQACEKVYKSEGDAAEVEVSLRVGPGARLDWTPQETILFDHARLSRRLEADLIGDAELLIVEAIILGRAAMGETMSEGLMRDRWRIRRDGKLIHAEELRIEGAFAPKLASPSVLGGAGAFATLALFSDEAERLVFPLRAALGPQAGVSAFGGKLIARVAAPGGAALRDRLVPAIGVLCDGRRPPRVWMN
jgi:urease accessory protein